MKFGWFVATAATGGEFERIRKICDRLQSVDMADTKAVGDAETAIFRVLSGPTFNPDLRAKFVRHGIQLRHFNAYSHLHESAIFAYYKKEYAAAVLLLLAALEGILLSVAGWTLGSPQRPGHKRLIEIVRSSTSGHSGTLAQAHDMYRDVFANFLESWLYTHTNDANLDVSVLNRHYIMHGFEPGNFYRPQDVHRMILAFDVLIDWLSFNQGNFMGIFVDTDDPLVAKRLTYYEALSEGDQTVRQTWRTERGLLIDHPRYVPPTAEHGDEMSQMMDFMAKLDLMRKAAEFKPKDS